MMLRSALLAAAVLFSALPVLAQGRRPSTVDLDSDSARARRRIAQFAMLSAAPCKGEPEPPDAAGPITLSQREWVRRRIRPIELPSSATGARLEDRVTTGPVRVTYLEFPSRLPGLVVPAYLLRPNGADPVIGRAIVIHGSRTAYEQAIGWNFGVGQSLGVTGQSPIIGIAVELARAGLEVLVPFIENDPAREGLERWNLLARHGHHLAVRGLGNTESILAANLLGALDVLGDGTGRPTVVVGDREGAALGMRLAAIDGRVGGVVSLMAPVDRRAMHGSLDQVFNWPSFTQVECAIDDITMARLLAPTPLLFITDAADLAHAEVRRRFGGAAIERDVRGAYEGSAPGGRLAIRSVGTHRDLHRVVSAWARDLFGAPPLLPGDTSAIVVPQPDGARVTPERLVAYHRELASAVAALAPYPSLAFTPVMTDEASYLRSVEPLRRVVWRTLVGTPMRIPAAARVIERDTVRETDRYTLERVALRLPTSGARVEALLATPRIRGREAPPMVFSTDATLGANEIFGLPPLGRTDYLGAYGDALAKAGYAVFAPIIEPEFPNLIAPFLHARDPGAGSSWSLLIPMYQSLLGSAIELIRPDSARVAVYGISFGGYAALALGAFDTRVTTLVHSNPSHVHALLFRSSTNDSAPWLSDGAAVWDVMERWLVFPKRYIREVEATARFERSLHERVHEIDGLYAAFGRSERFTFVAQPGGHRTKVEGILPWLDGR